MDMVSPPQKNIFRLEAARILRPPAYPEKIFINSSVMQKRGHLLIPIFMILVYMILMV